MQEEAVPISEEEASDTEIVMVGHSQPFSKQSEEHRLVDRQLKSQEGVIDSQLKALGLYEEGLSFEQKEELLAVVAVSRETAEQEESMRLKAKEWQEKVFSDEMDYEASVSLTGQSEQSLSLMTIDPTSHMVEGSLQLLNIEDIATSPSVCESQELFQSQDLENSQGKSSEEHSEEYGLGQSREACEPQCSKRGLSRRGRGRRGGARGRSHSDEGKASHSIAFNQSSDVYEVEVNDSQMDFRKQKRELEKLMPEWKPCSSPESRSMSIKRSSAEEKHQSSQNDHCKNVLKAIDEYHSAVDKLQRSSGTYIPWGQPVTVGRTYATRSTRGMLPEPENSDGILSFQSTSLSDEIMPHPDDSVADRYLQLRQFDMLFHSSSQDAPPETSSTKSTRSSVKTLVKKPYRKIAADNTLCKRTKLLNENHVPLNENLIPNVQSSEFIENMCTSTIVSDSRNSSTRSESLIEVQRHACGDMDQQLQLPANCESLESANEIEFIGCELLVRKDGQKTYSARTQSVPKSSTVSRPKRNCGKPDFIENSPPVMLDVSPSWNAQSYSQVDKNIPKRKRLACSIAKVSSPSKRLKESGAV